jgi:hypothetical protein
MNKEKVLKFGVIALILYYLRSYISKAMLGCLYVWNVDGLRFLDNKCFWIFTLILIISIIMWFFVICAIISIFSKESCKEVKNGKRKYRERS